MKSNHLSTVIHNIIKYMPVFLSLFTLLFCVYMHRNAQTMIQSGNVFHWTTGWSCEDEHLETLPCSFFVYKGNSLTITNTLPSDICDGDFLMFQTQYSRNDIYINHEPVYSYGNRNAFPFGSLYANIYCIVPLRASYQGQPIEIMITHNASKLLSFDGMIIGSKEAIFRYILQKNFWYVCVFVFILLIALGTILTVCLYTISHINFHTKLVFYYIALDLSLALYLYFHSDIFQFQSQKTTTGCLISQIAFLLLQVFSIGFCKELLQKRRFLIFEIISYVLLLFMLILYITGLVDPIDFSTPIMIFSPLVILYALIYCFKIRKSNTMAYYMFFDFLLLFIFIVLGQSYFYYYGKDDLSVKIFILGFVSFSLGLIFIIEKETVETSNNLVKARLYKKTAYIDEMTGLGNRLDFTNKMKEIQNRFPQLTPLTLIMCDLNYLKKTNDAFGHDAGDELIKAAAHCLKKVSNSDAFCYRFGGDEFAVLVLGSAEKGEYYVRKIYEQIKLYNKDKNGNLSISIGYAFDTLGNDDSQYIELYRKADEAMYAKKKELHNSR